MSDCRGSNLSCQLVRGCQEDTDISATVLVLRQFVGVCAIAIIPPRSVREKREETIERQPKNVQFRSVLLSVCARVVIVVANFLSVFCFNLLFLLFVSVECVFWVLAPQNS